MSVQDFFKTHRQVVVIDTEFTTWEGAYERGWSGEDEHREVFQISAIKVDLVADRFVETFNRFVYPRKNPLLSEYAKKLTGVSQHDVDTGVDFREMYTDFLAFTSGLPVCSYARGGGPEGEGVIFKENIDLYKLSVPHEPNRFINLVPLFEEAGVTVANFSSGKLHECFDVHVPGKSHDASHDVQSLAVSLIALKEEYFLLNPHPRC